MWQSDHEELTRIPIKGFNLQINAMIDSGSAVNVIKSSEYFKCGELILNTAKIGLTAFGGNEISTLGSFSATIIINGEKYVSQMHVVPDKMTEEAVIIGNALLKETNYGCIDGEFNIRPKCFLNHINVGKDNEVDLSHLSTEQSVEVSYMIEDYKPTNSKTTDIQLKIILADETPIYQHPRRLAEKEKSEVETQIDKWLREGIVRESSADFASCVVLVKKKDGTSRMCVDYRRIHKKIVQDKYPLPLIEDQLDALQDARVFSTLDLKNGFFHVKVHEDSVKYTAFVTHRGHYEFLKMPFGLKNGPAMFMRFINCVFRELLREGVVLAYMDDLIILSKSVTEGIERLKRVLKTAADYGLEIKWEKCQILQTKVEYLGYIVQDGVIKPNELKTMAGAKFPEPRNLKELQCFLGLTGYFRKFIKDYAILAKPISDLIKNNVKFIIGDRELCANESLKQALINKPSFNVV